MSPAERDQARQRYGRWRALPPQQRSALRERWQRFQTLSPAEQARVRENFHRFQQLPPARREMLRQQWRNATPEQRQRMIQHVREQRMRRLGMGHPGMGAHPGVARPHLLIGKITCGDFSDISFASGRAPGPPGNRAS